LEDVLWHGTLLGLFAALVAGGVGMPLPEDVSLIGAGLLAHEHIVALHEVIVVGLAGVMAGDWLVYLAGRRYGRDMVGHPRLARLLGAGRIEAVHGAIDRHGARAVFLARFVLGFRIVTFLAAGTFGVPAPAFGVAEAAGAAIFVPAMTTLGFLFADRAMRIVHGVGRAEHWVLLAGLVGIALYLGLRAIAGRMGLEARIIGRVPPPDAAVAHPPPTPGRDPRL
jgi:membrane protein DedA with SNARE-associated domain